MSWTWFKVDGKLHDHRKARKAGKAAMGVWVLAGSWSQANQTDGFVPADVLSRWGNQADARKLVEAGLWHSETHEGEDGWRFHDWDDFQPSAAVTAAAKRAEAESGRRGNHKRWHVDRGITDPDCEFCHRVPDREPDEVPEGGPESPPNRPIPIPIPSSSNEEELAIATELCHYLADALVANGCRQPRISKTWIDAAKRMVTIDGRSPDDIRMAIDWCHRPTTERGRFWGGVVLSMPKLREKYDAMRLQAEQERRPKLTAVKNNNDFEALLARNAERMGVENWEGPSLA